MDRKIRLGAMAVALALAESAVAGPLLAAAADDALPTNSNAAIDLSVRAYVLCVRRMAVRFEPSGESPETIADAATAACQVEGTNAFNDILRNSSSSMTPMQLQDSAKYLARAQVVFVRLCNKTNDCEFAHVP